MSETQKRELPTINSRNASVVAIFNRARKLVERELVDSTDLYHLKGIIDGGSITPQEIKRLKGVIGEIEKQAA